MKYEDVLSKYKNAESHFDVWAASFVRSPLSIVIAVVWSGVCFAAGKLL